MQVVTHMPLDLPAKDAGGKGIPPYGDMRNVLDFEVQESVWALRDVAPKTRRSRRLWPITWWSTMNSKKQNTGEEDAVAPTVYILSNGPLTQG